MKLNLYKPISCKWIFLFISILLGGCLEQVNGQSLTYWEDNAASGHYNTRYTYDLMGNMLTLKRNGLQDGGTYGLIDDVSFAYKGNQLLNAEDKVEDPTYKDAWNFVDGASENVEYGYDKNGNMVKDLNKGI